MLTYLFLALAAYIVYTALGGAPMLRMDRRNPAVATKNKIEELSQYAQRLKQDKKFFVAEKIFLQILKLDHKHVPTYTHLGLLYSAVKNYADAIECFQIAARLQPSGATYYNLGLGYYENRNFVKAIAAFEKANMFEPALQRYLALAKAHEKMGNTEKTLDALRQASELDDTGRVLKALAAALRNHGRLDELREVQEKLHTLSAKHPRAKVLPKAKAIKVEKAS
ncbi:MAG TPA: hypothetical protein VNA68_00420 [Candidatus Dormibacteraeota bacterium]|nr:hypothetical protein [Candidatus Dormibacteraeota bacterium]